MRLLSLEVERFGPIRRAVVELGPGLNVLYGPNDIGKSSLTEAIRAALLLVPTSTHHATYVPWGTDQNPSVALTFQVEPPERWRVKKTFATGSRGTALLERGGAEGSFSREATGRDVEARLRALLRWGVQAPSGKRGASGLTETYLSQLLIGRQSEVAALFERSLEQDQDESGKQRLTVALKALAQDPLLRRLLDRAQARTDLVFSGGGVLRRAQDSPLVRVREEVRAAEERLTLLNRQTGGGEVLEAQLALLSGQRVESARRLEDALARRGKTREAAARGQARGVAQRQIEEAQRALDQVRAAHQAVGAKAREAEGRRAELVRAEADHETARDTLASAEQALRAGEARLEAITTERAGTRELRRQTLETRRLELEATREQAARRAESARRVGALATEADVRQSALDSAEAELGRAEGAVSRAAAELELETAHVELEEGRALVTAVTDAETQLAARRTEVERVAKRLSEATVAVETADAALEQARERTERARSQGGAQQRALKEEELTRRRLEAQAALGQAEAQAQRARDAQAVAARAKRCEEQLDAARTVLAEASAGVGVAEQALAKAHGIVDRLALVLAFMEWRGATTRCNEAVALVTETDRLSAQAAELRARADALEADLQKTPIPDLRFLPGFRSLDRDLAAAEAKLEVGLSVIVNPRQTFELRAAADEGEADVTTATPGEELVCDARRKLQLTIGELADLTIIGGRQEDHTRAQELRSRWTVEVQPVLRACGVPDLPGLEALLRSTAERGLELATLRQQVASLEIQSQRAGEATVRLEAAQRAVAERLSALAGHDPVALEKEAAGLGLLAPAGPLFSQPRPVASPTTILDGRRREAAAALDEARNRLETARVGQAQSQLRVETALRELEQARGEQDVAGGAITGSADDALRTASEEAAVARRTLVALDGEQAALAQEQDSALSEARRLHDQAEAARTTARRAREQEQKAHDEAQRSASAIEGQLEVRRQAARGVDLASLERRRAELADALARLPATLAPAVRPHGEGALAHLRASLEKLRTTLATAQSRQASARTARDAATTTAHEAQRELATDWQAALTLAQAAQASAAKELAAIQHELASLELHRDDAIAAATTDLLRVKEILVEARLTERSKAAARDVARTLVDTAQAQLSMLREVAATQDEHMAAAEVSRCQSAAASSPPPEPGVQHDVNAVEAADAAVRDAERGLEQARLELGRVQAQLEITGGAIVQERIDDARSAVERLTRKQQEVELDFSAWKLLRDTLVEAEASQQTHLGERLAGPVTQRFRDLTGGRYGPLAMGPNLDTLGITVAGERRALGQLSVGTRDQLSAILRLTVAAELQSALVLDDQLAQSDPRRLGWFSQALRDTGKAVQVLVITCRADDYVHPDEMPAGAMTFRDSPDGLLRAVNLEKLIERCASGA